MSRFLAVFAAAAFISLAVHAASPGKTEAGGEPVDFQRDVRPILSDNCFLCHGPDESTRIAGLRLDLKEGLFGKRENGTPVVPGDPEASLLYERITHENEMMRMPPAYSKKELSEEEIATLTRWIEEGAPWEQHWSFKPVERPELPEVGNEEWIRNPIDRFILARLEKEGLEPAPEADRRTFIRRVTLDLTGLPPEPEDVEAFVNDPSEDAYLKVVNRLLDSPHYGEHRARYWLDAARYGDTHGLHIDNYREMWPYRDWVIDAFNENMPFDQFTIEQLAGDLLPDPTLDQLIATGFHRNNVTTNEAGVIPEEVEAMYANDRAETTGMVWLGLTVGCAACHDHKFDPVSQKDFYSLTAFFRNTTQHVMDLNVSDPPPILVVPQYEDRPRWKELREEREKIEARMEEVREQSDGQLDVWLAEGGHRDITSSLNEESKLLKLKVEDQPVVEANGGRTPIKLVGNAKVGEGPLPGYPALHFPDPDSWAELPNLGLDGKRPFSITAWLLHPDDQGSFVIASRSDPEDHKRGWSLNIGARVSGFSMIGDQEKPEGGSYTRGVEVRAGHLQQMEPGGWHHIAVTYDGTGERAGMHFYLDGKVIPNQGSEYFTKIVGSILTEDPVLLGHQPGETQDRHFAGGAIADFRVYNRAITAEEARLITLWPTLQKASQKTPEELTSKEKEALKLYYVNRENDPYRQLAGELRELELEKREIRRRGAVTHIMQERKDRKPFAHVLKRGMYDQPQERVRPGVPSALPPIPASYPRNRLGLAKWLVSDLNPLTPRVTVNRFWQQVFGEGVVPTPDDFGSQGRTPTHPELLDWLAAEFRSSGWDVKDFFRLMVTSAAYRQSARTTKEKLEKDPNNVLLSRGPRFRMDGEMIRDYVLASSGLLTRKIGGPSVKPYQPEGVWETVAMLGSNTRFYKRDEGEKLYRRSVYTFWKRAAPPASMAIFNAPTREHAVVERERTNTPLQALVTLNDTQFVEASRHLAQRAMLEGGEDFNSRLDFMTLRVLARPFDEQERQVARRTYENLLEFYEANPGEAQELINTGVSKSAEDLPAPESAAYTMLASQLFNLDETLKK